MLYQLGIKLIPSQAVSTGLWIGVMVVKAKFSRRSEALPKSYSGRCLRWEIGVNPTGA